MLTKEILRQKWAREILRFSLVNGEIGGWKYIEKYPGKVLSPVMMDAKNVFHVENVSSAIDFLIQNYPAECSDYVEKHA
jgi:hypothetical protein